MAASQRPGKKMVSRCNPDTERGTLVFDIAGYSLLKGGLGDSDFIRSASFTVGGHDWCIRYYPKGVLAEDSEGYISIYLELMSKTTRTGVMARFDLRLLNQATGVSTVLTDQVTPRLFKSVNETWGTQTFKKIRKLEASPYLQNDRIVIECDITVVLGTPVSAPETVCEIQVPPSGLLDDLRKLLEAEKRTDIRFKVEGEVFRAHKFVLATRAHGG
ncbi:BTB/POZ and MATH domain-containing protein 3-like [Panicum miliaceum]|uniref:BTB/POZ and MATH domain-containing protein 3-like n=1 Tax=Panicum miliaceum TaxID=4540 RepID=A0A3L6PNI6_PANMI|nr:BTB/POZ and MATH domain-containing protein 3-like [Panicum miliaceum]